MEIKIAFYDPCGNITALVETPLAAEQRQALAEELLQREELHIEQIGFLCPPRGDGLVRVELAGGEFCGNSLRCAALHYVQSGGLRGQHIVPVEVSGAEQCVPVAVNSFSRNARAVMPLPRRYYQAIIEDMPAYVCDFGSLVNIVLPDEYPEQETVDMLLQYAVVHFHAAAVALIFLPPDAPAICPVVYVPALGSLVFETGCACGAMAASVYAVSQRGNGNYHFEWQQMGGIMPVELKKRGGRIEKLTLSGVIKNLPSLTLQMEDGQFSSGSRKAEIRSIHENGNKKNR